MPSKSQSFCIEKMRKPIKKEKTPRWDFHGLIRSDYRITALCPPAKEAIACRGASVSKKHTAPNFFRSGAFLLD